MKKLSCSKDLPSAPRILHTQHTTLLPVTIPIIGRTLQDLLGSWESSFCSSQSIAQEGPEHSGCCPCCYPIAGPHDACCIDIAEVSVAAGDISEAWTKVLLVFITFRVTALADETEEPFDPWKENRTITTRTQCKPSRASWNRITRCYSYLSSLLGKKQKKCL